LNYKDIVERAGGKFLGVEGGLVWFDAPSHSTLVIEESEFSAWLVKEKIEEDGHKTWNHKAA
jgi:hypothetical protein